MDTKYDVAIVSAQAGSNQADAVRSYDDNELSEWANDGQLSTAWITYTLARKAEVDDICMKLNGWRSRSYPLEVYAGDKLIWSGNTEKSLGYIHLEIAEPVRTNEITVRLKGSTDQTSAIFRLDTNFGGGKTHALIAMAHVAKLGATPPPKSLI